jgi:hypothetical protein
MSTKIWIVEGSTGKYDSYRTWVVAMYFSEALAHEHRRHVEQAAEILLKRDPLPHYGTNFGNEWDPEMESDGNLLYIVRPQEISSSFEEWMVGAKATLAKQAEDRAAEVARVVAYKKEREEQAEKLRREKAARKAVKDLGNISGISVSNKRKKNEWKAARAALADKKK